MAKAMIDPLIKKGYQPESQVAVYDVSTKAVRDIQHVYPNINVARSIEEVVTGAECVVLAVKPQNITDAFWEQFPKDESKLPDTLLSILAGTPVESFKQSGIKKIARSMPNTPSTIGQGMTVWCCTPNMTTEERDTMSKLLHTFGKAIYVDDEKFVDMSTSISGSGPAYIFMLMEAMIDSGVHMGFSRETATTLVHHTLLGSTLYAMETDLHPAILRNSVTSPAGTTASAIYELEKGGLRPLVNDAIWACYRRSLEMGGKNSAVGPGMNRAMGERPHITLHHHYNTPSGEMKLTDSDDEDDGTPAARKATHKK
jgi:pyrroline-5-carboxylate reductase